MALPGGAEGVYRGAVLCMQIGHHCSYDINTGPLIPERDEMAAETAKAAGVRHLVKLSSMDVEHGLALGAWHERGEAAIRAKGISFTFVQPTGFMSNLLAWRRPSGSTVLSAHPRAMAGEPSFTRTISQPS